MSVDKSPVYEVKAVPVEKVYANDYNPNMEQYRIIVS